MVSYGRDLEAERYGPHRILQFDRWEVDVTVHLLYHGIFLFSFLRRTPLLFGMYSYDWIHTLILLSSLNSSFVEL